MKGVGGWVAAAAVVPLAIGRARVRAGKAVLKMQSVAGTVRDTDKLKITCLPSDATP